MGFQIVDEDGLAEELQRLSQLRFDAVILKNMTQIYNRGKADGGTPVLSSMWPIRHPRNSAMLSRFSTLEPP